MSDKIKIFTISDHPLSPSGVGTQTKYIIEGMLKTGKYEFVSFGGAIKHPQHDPQHTEQWGTDWIIWPVDGYGNADMVRAMLHQQKPDIVWFMTDPRFYTWLWDIEHEIRAHCPMVYYHVWDNYPYPTFNKVWYNSTDHIACISKLTHDIVQTVSPDVGSSYIPHAVNMDVFAPMDPEITAAFRKEKKLDDKFVVLWNNRNARRKQSGSLIYWFKAFLDKNDAHGKATLIMHTDPKDVHGQDLEAIMRDLNLLNGEVLISKTKVNAEDLAGMYNMADVTINISDAEGFGLATLESLSCGTPIIVNMTGGMQDQVTDGENWYGIGLEPVSKAIIGSQEVPFIYEDRLSEEQVVEALTQMYTMSAEERTTCGEQCREWALRGFNFDTFVETWDELFTNIYETHGSWTTRTGYDKYTVKEL
jgi:glycosyltransferase involved in cell wall biosynthesis